MIRIIILLVLSFSVFAEITLVNKGYYNVYCNDEFISQHSTERKAIQKAINKNSKCHIEPPILEIIGSFDTQIEENYSIELNWDTPKQREDGSVLEPFEISHYNIYYSTNSDNLNNIIEVTGNSTTINDLIPNIYYFAISTVDSDNKEGGRSTIISQELK